LSRRKTQTDGNEQEHGNPEKRKLRLQYRATLKIYKTLILFTNFSILQTFIIS